MFFFILFGRISLLCLDLKNIYGRAGINNSAIVTIGKSVVETVDWNRNESQIKDWKGKFEISLL